MEREAYFTREWRELPRDGECVVAFLFGLRAGDCAGPIHRHHVDPPDERSVQVCERHHPRLEAALRHLHEATPERRCTHEHRYPWAREACERRMNALQPA